MNTKTTYLSLLFAALLALASCAKNDNDGGPAAADVTLHFTNTFKETPIVLGDATSATATVNTSASGQEHHFAELKYVVSNIRLVTADGREIPYHSNDLDRGALVVDQAKPQTLTYVLHGIPAGEYRQLKFGLGVPVELNTLDEVRFPAFYAAAGANDTEMMWEWGTGYRFTKIEGFYGADHQPLSIHTGSTKGGDKDDPSTWNWEQGVDAYRDITLNLGTAAVVGASATEITIRADFDHLLSGTNTITLGGDNAKPDVIHTAKNMVLFVDNLGGDGTSGNAGMFSITEVVNR